MIDLTWAIVGGIVLIAVMGGLLWLLCMGLVDVVDWIAGVIETALKKAANRW